MVGAMPNSKMNLVIIANCQVQPLQASLSALPVFDQVQGLAIHLKGTKFFDDGNERVKALLESEEDVLILTFHLGEEWDEYATSNLRQRFDKVFTISNLHFSGLHPDVTYLNEVGARFTSPIGDYHSKLILYAVTNGLSEQQCLELFTAKNFEQLGYFGEFERSKNILSEREQMVDLKFADKFFDLLTQHPALYTFNHPTAFIFHAWTVEICRQLNFDYANKDFSLESNFLANNTWYPVYPEVARHHGLKYPGNYLFKQPQHMGGKFMDFKEFIAQSYAAYSDKREALLNSRQMTAINQQLAAIQS